MIASLLSVSWQAALVAAGAWTFCRLCPRMPAHARAALWWLVCAKFLVGLAWSQPLTVAVLPAGLDDAIAVAASYTRAIEASWTASPAARAQSPATTAPLVTATNGPYAEAHRDAAAATFRAVSRAIRVLWVGGLLLQFAFTWRAWRRTRALVHTSAPASAPVAALAQTLGQRLGVPHVAVRVNPSIDTPRVTGAFAPIVLLPTGADQLPRTELEMTLCHELLHVRRRDLLLGWLPSLTQGVFFFHPAAWLAAHEYALAREAACDAAVLRVLGAEPDAYGALLLRLGITRRVIAPIAVGASGSFRTLKRRLIMLQHTSEPGRTHAWRWWIAAAVAALAIVPLRLTALNALSETPSPQKSEASSAAMRAQPQQTPEDRERQETMKRQKSEAEEQANRQHAENEEHAKRQQAEAEELVKRQQSEAEELANRQQADTEERAKRLHAETEEQMKQLHGEIEKQMRTIHELLAASSQHREQLERAQQSWVIEQERFRRQQEAFARTQVEATKRLQRELRELIERALATSPAQQAH